ncbi:delta-60 repeat domain-containing protein [Nocardioides sp. TRM66260-LWL]|nr:delta-60 repeat domain-containing protein [Nocardioides sp. TRM66260-LWL]
MLSAAPSFAASGTIAPGASNGIARTRTLNLLLTLTPAPADPLTVADVAALYSAPDTTTTAFAPTGSGTGPGATYLLTATTATTPAPDTITVSGAIRGYGTIPSTVVELVKAGSRDNAFSTALAGSIGGQVFALAVQPNGGIIVGGSLADAQGRDARSVQRLDPSGRPDPAFDVGAFDRVVSCLAIDAAGGILVGGTFTQVGTRATGPLVRFTSDGVLDTDFLAALGAGFASLGGGPIVSVQSLAVQADGKIVVGGVFTHLDGQPSGCVARLHPDGRPDLAFLAEVGVGAEYPGSRAYLPGFIASLDVDAAGRILAAGSFSSFAGDRAVNSLVRLQPDGRRDADFRSAKGPGMFDVIWAVRAQPDGRVLIGGGFRTFDGQAAVGLTRLMPDGTRDADFTAALGTGFDYSSVRAIALQPDGRIIVGGGFSTVSGTTGINQIVRLDPSGTRETIFSVNTGSGFTGTAGVGSGARGVNVIVRQADGRLIVGGVFTAHDGTTGLGKVVRLFG